MMATHRAECSGGMINIANQMSTFEHIVDSMLMSADDDLFFAILNTTSHDDMLDSFGSYCDEPSDEEWEECIEPIDHNIFEVKCPKYNPNTTYAPCPNANNILLHPPHTRGNIALKKASICPLCGGCKSPKMKQCIACLFTCKCGRSKRSYDAMCPMCAAQQHY